ncbi:hypothetical protein LCGC14_1969720 [marine sediment metagenome]|uniref:IrrE N-terminal-like domain-containing protein n=1 Tax=marine sediment metagenome TaxID=412755 RepID=A0A0F9FCK5_9ZZZZ
MSKPKATTKNKQVTDIMKFKEYVIKILNGMQSYMCLLEYTLEIEFPKVDNNGAFAEIKTDVVYFNVNIKIYPVTKKLYEQKKYFQVFSYLVHELCHILIEPMSQELSKYLVKGENNDLLEDVTERQTQRIAIAISRNVKEYVWNPEYGE